MRITRTKAVPQQVTVGVKCDVCGKVDYSIDPQGWHHFHHGHTAWDSDSCDSIEYFDVCSVECYAKQLDKSIKSDGHQDGFEVDGMTATFAKALLVRLTSAP